RPREYGRRNRACYGSLPQSGRAVARALSLVERLQKGVTQLCDRREGRVKKKVVVAMSGGVDSSVTAALLKEQGYEVFGVTMKLSDWQETEGRKFGGCCGSKDFYDARSVAQTLGIPHYSFDYVEKFRVSVISYFKDSYLKGETPNPCIACNQHVKFDALLHQALALGADYLATGHYARIQS